MFYFLLPSQFFDMLLKAIEPILFAAVCLRGSSVVGCPGTMSGSSTSGPKIATWQSETLGLKATMEMEGAEIVRVWYKQPDGSDLKIFDSMYPLEQKSMVLRELTLNAEEFEQSLGIFLFTSSQMVAKWSGLFFSTQQLQSHIARWAIGLPMVLPLLKAWLILDALDCFEAMMGRDVHRRLKSILPPRSRM